jgi:hypothetical protein
MPRVCTVCAHLQRAAIDERLALQVVNVAQVARDYGLDRKAVARHRDQHLPQFLRAFAGQALGLDAEQLNAEAQRLYLITLDALARAEHGALSHIDEDGKAQRRVSNTAIARFIREARQGLDLLAKLSAATPPPETSHEDGKFAQRVQEALGRIEALQSRRLELTALDRAELLGENDAASVRVHDTNSWLAQRAHRASTSTIDAEACDE